MSENIKGWRDIGAKNSTKMWDMGELVEKKIKNRHNAECSVCHYRQTIPFRAWARHCRPRCARCGGLLDKA